MTMTSTREHYDRHLGPVYSWMAGGVESALARGTAELEALGITGDDIGGHTRGYTRGYTRGQAIDLGAGFGMHAIPLAQRGFEVLAIDSCSELLAELREHAAGLPIETVEDDLQSFARHRTDPVDLVLCMGDTLTHLPDEAAVRRLAEKLSTALRPGGHFVVTLRDYSTPLLGEQRFIPVRSDATRILTCFLEYDDAHVTVHDVLHTWDGSRWDLRVGRYRKLRIPPDWLEGLLREHGFSVDAAPGPAGMLRLIARRD